MVRSVSIAVALLLSCSAFAQNSQRVHQAGSVTRGHAPVYMAPGMIGDAGGSLAGKIQTLGITPLPTNTLAPFCINDLPTSSPSGYHQICIRSDALGGTGLTYGPIGGATNAPFTIQSANNLAMTSGNQQLELPALPQTVAGDVAVCINTATGQLFKSSAVDRYIILTDETSTYYLTDEAGANYLAAFIPAGSCIQQ